MRKLLQIMALLLCTALYACSSDEPNRPDDDNPAGSTNNSSVTINADGSTSTGVVFAPIDETSFFLDYIKYEIVDSHLEIVGYDPIEIAEDVKPYATVNYLGVSYNTRVVADDAFNGCTSISSISLPESLTSIGYRAFRGCTSLSTISLPESLTEIGFFAFGSCTSLTTIKCMAKNPPSIDWNFPFNDTTYQNAILYVPTASVELYKKAYCWSSFANIQGF
ncbi:MAG: leucine-rich repeat domain-containing protein [Muribaculaceae bacterium]|nr:leucine-rich repeat domain-containing protein [Muribaculaceae bacterium]